MEAVTASVWAEMMSEGARRGGMWRYGAGAGAGGAWRAEGSVAVREQQLRAWPAASAASGSSTQPKCRVDRSGLIWSSCYGDA